VACGPRQAREIWGFHFLEPQITNHEPWLGARPCSTQSLGCRLGSDREIKKNTTEAHPHAQGDRHGRDGVYTRRWRGVGRQ
jgi:hypothetical protein